MLYENSFLILPDEKTLIGSGGAHRILQTEDSTCKEDSVVIYQKSLVYTMVYNENLNSLLVGYVNGCVSQYNLKPSGVLEKQTDYGEVLVSRVDASDWSGDIAVVGGGDGEIRLIDMRRRQVLGHRIQTALGSIYTLQFCRVSQKEMHLLVGGCDSDYSNSKSDLFDVSAFFKDDYTPLQSEVSSENNIRELEELLPNQTTSNNQVMHQKLNNQITFLDKNFQSGEMYSTLNILTHTNPELKKNKLFERIPQQDTRIICNQYQEKQIIPNSTQVEIQNSGLCENCFKGVHMEGLKVGGLFQTNKRSSLPMLTNNLKQKKIELEN